MSKGYITATLQRRTQSDAWVLVNVSVFVTPPWDLTVASPGRAYALLLEPVTASDPSAARVAAIRHAEQSPFLSQFAYLFAWRKNETL
jgi:hypothetical protein